jgi:hypothetical protein
VLVSSLSLGRLKCSFHDEVFIRSLLALLGPLAFKNLAANIRRVLAIPNANKFFLE